MILSRFYDEKSAGFYVDIGAHHPIRFSNTYKFYRRGWNGLNVDATPGSMNIFRYLRPRDINIEAAIGSEGQHLTFYEFDEPALNTLSAEVAKERNGGRYHIVRETPLITQSMAGLLDVYVPGNIRIDFLSIDVEGLDCEVLSSNDWGRYRPELILAECFGVSTIEEVAAEPVYRLLSSYGYKMVAKTVNTVIFRVDA
ncbi:MAG: FkbM family methyltransferase [Puia sp.]|nr:FkbM family methyltransferase [Puia sp.]